MADERRKHLLRDPKNPTAGLCATAHLEVMVHGDCLLVRTAKDATCHDCTNPPGQTGGDA